MRTETVLVYRFDELDASAKEHARNWYRTDMTYGWAGENIDSLKAFADHFNLKITNYSLGGSDNRSQGVEYTIKSEDWLIEMSGIRLWKHMTNQMALPDLSGNCPFTGYCFDETLLNPIREFMKRPSEISYEELIRECIDAFCMAYADDSDYTFSDEAVDESILANEYEFTEHGDHWS